MSITIAQRSESLHHIFDGRRFSEHRRNLSSLKTSTRLSSGITRLAFFEAQVFDI